MFEHCFYIVLHGISMNFLAAVNLVWLQVYCFLRTDVFSSLNIHVHFIDILRKILKINIGEYVDENYWQRLFLTFV